ncbi:MAG: LysE family translocator [Alphaproteobacteria bacterium]
MNSIDFFIRGIAVGFVIAAPVGPIGVLCIRRTLAYGRIPGLLSGLGAALADSFYGCIAAFGITAVSDFLIGQGTLLRLLGGVVLCLLGLKTFLATPAEEGEEPQARTLAGAFGSTFFLTLTNPMTILAFAAIFAGLGLGTRSGNLVAAAALVGGVFLGSALWWIGLSATTGLFHGRIADDTLGWINRVSGSLIGGFGIAALVSGLSQLS